VKKNIGWLYRQHRGVPVNQALQNDMRILKKELGLFQYNFPFEGDRSGCMFDYPFADFIKYFFPLGRTFIHGFMQQPCKI
jgi:hypothetical protein